ncbi:MAG: protoheme IX farnesyltransferase [Planctomycetaceae bacterium TMED240]|nr:protoheme IX farnesyltransferase [Rhodopirellula sp.]OUX05403.1 MAG: protoheme IX farnesyltransferase [Planctomycetaceae bacterium TMED240]
MATDLLSADTATTAGAAVRSGEALPQKGSVPVDVSATDSGDNTDRGLRIDAASKNEEGQGGYKFTSEDSGSVEGRAAGSRLWSDLLQLTKPRIVVMILVTTCATAMIGASGLVNAGTLFWLLLGTAAIAGSAGASNQIWERVIDSRMTRTANRPISSGRMSPTPAVIFATVLGVIGTAILAYRFGVTPAAVGVATWLLYVLVYTPMKVRTAWNTTVGAIAGAIPVLIGYTAAGGLLTDGTGWLLVGVLVAWQYPHFMAIAWMYRRQYQEAGFKMTTTEEPTGRSAGWQSIVGSAVLIGMGVTLCWLPLGITGAIVGSIAVIAAAWPMLLASIRFANSPDDKSARKLLRSSLLVLPAVLAVVTLRLFW